ncbi:MAG: HslU--HslV peptidase ATPase subunit, partial [Spirochaetae bacterium HGW-Spirochaetae-6]
MFSNKPNMQELTPKKVVELLDRYVIGQKNAKKAVAIALRNRTRRMMLEGEMREEIAPKNILMIGPTGVGKTELARRLAKLVNAPFVKVEATKYTEVGYVGRDVESMVRDLVSNSISMIKKEMEEKLEKTAEDNVEERLLDLLLPETKSKLETDEAARNVWMKMKEKLSQGLLDEKEVTFKVKASEGGQGPVFGVLSNMGMEDLEEQFQSMLGQIMPAKKKDKKMLVKNARRVLKEEELEKLIDFDKVKEEAIKRAEELGIIFL